MSQRRTVFTGPALIRLLARLTEAEVPESQQAFADRLSQWLGWADAISLSSAMNGSPAPASAPVAAARPSSARAEEGECVRVRASLAKAIAEDNLFAPPPPVKPAASRGVLLSRNQPYEPPPPPAPVVEEGDFTPYRLRYQARQLGMEAALSPLREQLRARLSAQSPDAARLASLDAVMEQVLGEQERRLLGLVPGMLEKHFARLRKRHRLQAEEAAAADPEAGLQAPPEGQWLQRFCRDAQAVLMAELEIRFQPVEGLVEALRATSIQQRAALRT
ncbi:DUF3348 domain-containing protein [Variovorax sp. OV329]|uniref:DUF3348 domain-containing protein n=1 Tax=Variovorax sp. OV329 TaxID=1882825 RepID=UPI0034A19BCB